mmetsp:Transcript_14320/g.33766  ORF Transcript_14320/g.33766 Transcript_14320/m.33766 type:complete len:204 (-) Transcript_14320:100-711(-)
MARARMSGRLTTWSASASARRSWRRCRSPRETSSTLMATRHRAASCMRSLPPKTATTARTSPSSPWPTPRASSSVRSRRRCPSQPSSATTSWPRLQPLSRRSASSRTSTGGCPHARPRPIARRPVTRKNTPRPSSRAVTTRTTQRVSSGRLLAAGAVGAASSAASSLARCRGPACACPPDEGFPGGVAWRLAAAVSLRAARQG